MSSFVTCVRPGQTALGESKEKLEDALERLQRLNSSFPATREFLEARGLDSVAQLDRQGVNELREHLQKVYKRLVH